MIPSDQDNYDVNIFSYQAQGHVFAYASNSCRAATTVWYEIPLLALTNGIFQ